MMTHGWLLFVVVFVKSLQVPIPMIVQEFPTQVECVKNLEVGFRTVIGRRQGTGGPEENAAFCAEGVTHR